MAAKGKWAQGIVPRNFAWVIKDKLAFCERPGGYGQNHRRVRRQEEIIWVREQGFDHVVSVIPSPHNLHNYDELDVSWLHRPFEFTDVAAYIARLYPELYGLLDADKKVLLHRDEVNDLVCGLLAGYLRWSGMVMGGPQVISIMEQISSRQLGPRGRQFVAMAGELRARRPPPS